MLVLLIFNCFQSISQIASPPQIPLPEISLKPIVDGTTILFIQCPAEFPGGIDSLKHYYEDFGKHIPDNWADSSFNKLGYVLFVVEKDGTLSNIEVRRSITKEADVFMLELVQKMPKWTPACDQYGPVRCRSSLPITFIRPD